MKQINSLGKVNTVTDIRSKKKKGNNRKPCVSILVEDLHVGDEIVTHFASSKFDNPIDEVIAFLTEGQYTTRFALKSQKVQRISICEGQWRTHIHVNGMYCYDTRQRVWVTV